MKKIANNLFIFYLLSFTWGLLTSFIGFLIMIPFLITGKIKTFHGRLYGVFEKSFGSGWGFEMGCFFFTSYDCVDDVHTLAHECGHGLQNIIWGPLMIFVISIPSFIRFWMFEYNYKVYLKDKTKAKKLGNYEDIWFEKQATVFGFRYLLDKEITI